MALQAPNIDLDTAKEFVKDITLPAQPQMLLDIRKAYPDIDKIAALVSRDPAIGASVLKTVNSPLFGIPKKIVKIEQAVMLLGLDSVMNIVNAVLLRASLSQNIDPEKLKYFWQGANDTAIAAGFIAKQLKLKQADQAFVLGLFHNCAMPLMLEKFDDYLDKVALAYQEHSRTLTDLEDDLYQANHAIIGQHIARAWHLPAPIIDAIGEHHSPDRLQMQSEDDEQTSIDNLCAVLKLAEHIVGEYKILGDDEENYEWTLHGEKILEQLDLNEDSYVDICEETLEAIQEADLGF